MKMDRSLNLNLLHEKLGFLSQYKKVNVCPCNDQETAIMIENEKDWEVKYLPESWG